MVSHSADAPIGVLAGGGLDSGILLAHLLEQNRFVQPFYVRTGVCWEAGEMASLERYIRAIATPRLQKLVVLEMPLADVYGEHWSLTGRAVPGYDSPDEAVFLPGRNALLLVKPVIWSQSHGIAQLAVATLGTSPFADAGAEFFADFQAALGRGARPVELLRPFGHLTKREVMKLGAKAPLELTFSCLAPRNGLHCGACNKCAERKAAFASVGREDRTPYAAPTLVE